MKLRIAGGKKKKIKNPAKKQKNQRWKKGKMIRVRIKG